MIAIPLAIELTRKVHGGDLLDAVWAIPVAAVAAVASLVFARGSRGITAARVLAVTGICLALSSALAYFDSYRTPLLPQSLTQAQRDAFGAHTYERIDHPERGFVHTEWLA